MAQSDKDNQRSVYIQRRISRGTGAGEPQGGAGTWGVGGGNGSKATSRDTETLS